MAVYVPKQPNETFGHWFMTNPETQQRVLWQNPNLPLWLFIIMRLSALLLPGDVVPIALKFLAFVCLLWWAVLETFDGDAPWRRVLGVLGIALASLSLIRMVLV